ncbi:MAG TPA: hypothetical protein PK095_04820 [Myxococcota bacterium]|nr:hypothetical protein [Myxococcota bacterium]
MRWVMVFGGMLLGCGDGESATTPEAEVEVVDTREVEETSEDSADGVPETSEPDASAEVTPPDVDNETVEVDTNTPDTAVEPDVEITNPTCADGCPPGMVCEADVCVCDTAPVSYANDIAPRFTTGCGPGCHVYSNAASGSAGLNLAIVHSYDELVGVTAFQCRDGRVRVVPGDPGSSYLMQKMLGQDMCTGVRMPKGRQAWSAADMAMIGRWICQGAQDN